MTKCPQPGRPYPRRPCDAEYISPEISPARLITPYVRGWFQKAGSQLYVNSGIGTIFSPVSIGSPPEITIYELKRA